LSVSLDPVSPLVYTAPDHVELTANVDAINSDVAVVRFRAGAILIGEVAAAPYRMIWSEAPAGSHEITAEVVDTEGTVTSSEVWMVEVLVPPTEASHSGTNFSHHGNWLGLRGGSGYVIPSMLPNLPDDIEWSVTGDSEAVWSSNSSESRALELSETED